VHVSIFLTAGLTGPTTKKNFQIKKPAITSPKPVIEAESPQSLRAALKPVAPKDKPIHPPPPEDDRLPPPPPPYVDNHPTSNGKVLPVLSYSI